MTKNPYSYKKRSKKIYLLIERLWTYLLEIETPVHIVCMHGIIKTKKCILISRKHENSSFNVLAEHKDVNDSKYKDIGVENDDSSILSNTSITLY